MWSNDIKCKYMFMFPLQNLACKGLIKIWFIVGYETEALLDLCDCFLGFF